MRASERSNGALLFTFRDKSDMLFFFFSLPAVTMDAEVKERQPARGRGLRSSEEHKGGMEKTTGVGDKR